MSRRETTARGECPKERRCFPSFRRNWASVPLLLAVLHAMVFLAGSDEDVVHPDAAEEAMEYMADYLQRLEGDRSWNDVREDIACLIGLCPPSKAGPSSWSASLKTFLEDYRHRRREAKE